MKTPEAVIFDFGNVLYRFDRKRFVEHLEKLTGKPGAAIYRAIYESDLPRRFEVGEMNSREFYEAACRVAEIEVEYDRFIECFCSMFFPVEGMKTLVENLAKRYRLGLLSNTNEIHFEHFISKREFFPLFQAVTLSYQVGVMKPDRKIYEDVIGKLGLPPGACVFVDDVDDNVRGAEEVGLVGVLFRDKDLLVEDLMRLGVHL